MALVDGLLQELEGEAGITKRLLERVPGEKLEWRPHAKSMTLGQLAYHVAEIPGNIARMVQVEFLDLSTVSFEPVTPKDYEAVMREFADGLELAKSTLGGMTDAFAGATWRLVMHGQVMMEMPRTAVLRTLMMNHLYHHRGQLTVYLRLLDVPLPVIYGRSADENPFG
jgi:uncharacterized damage-inducible protein DinB